MEITNHAYRRAKERVGWSKSALQRMAIKAMNLGEELSASDNKSTVLYGKVVFVFKNERLVTVYVDTPKKHPIMRMSGKKGKMY